MGQVGSPPPPPPYAPGSQRPPTYYATPSSGYAFDSKDQTTYVQGSYANQYMPSGNTGQYPFPQPYDPNQGRYQQNAQGEAPPTSISGFPGQPGQSYLDYGSNTPYLHQAHHNFPSPSASSHPQTPVQQTQQLQSYQPQQPNDQYSAANTHGQELHPSLSGTSMNGAYDMKTMTESLSMVGTDVLMAHKRQKPQSVTRKPVATPLRENQSQVTQKQSHQVISQSSSPQSLEGPYYASQASSQPSSSTDQESQVDISSLCGLDLTAPPSTRVQDSTMHYREPSMQPSSAVKQLLQQDSDKSVQENPKEKPAVQPDIDQQYYPSYIVQRQPGFSGTPQGQQTPSSVSQSQRYSLQPSLAPSPLPTPSPQFPPGQPQTIPYFPPPPGQPPQSAYNPATFSPLPARPSYAQPQSVGQKYTTPEVQYPPVPIPEPYSPAARPASFYGQMASPNQIPPHIPLQSKPQQHAPPMQYNMTGYTQMPLTPPYSPPQSVQQTGSSYFSPSTNAQYQNMYPAHNQ